MRRKRNIYRVIDPGTEVKAVQMQENMIFRSGHEVKHLKNAIRIIKSLSGRSNI